MKKYKIVSNAEDNFYIEKRSLFFFWDELYWHYKTLKEAEEAVEFRKRPKIKFKKQIICYR